MKGQLQTVECEKRRNQFELDKIVLFIMVATITGLIQDDKEQQKVKAWMQARRERRDERGIFQELMNLNGTCLLGTALFSHMSWM